MSTYHLSAFTGVDATGSGVPVAVKLISGQPGDILVSAVVLSAGTSPLVVGGDYVSDFNSVPVSQIPNIEVNVPPTAINFIGSYVLQAAGTNAAGAQILGLFQRD